MPKPEGHTDVSPYLLVPDIEGALAFLQAAFGAEPLRRMPNAEGEITHAEARIGDSVVMLGRAPGPEGVMVHLYCADADAAHARALDAGATLIEPMTDQPDGDRRGGVRDPWGIHWYVSRSA